MSHNGTRFRSLASTRVLFADRFLHVTDIIELGVPFTDPIADGPTIQTSNTVRRLNTLYKTTLRNVADRCCPGCPPKWRHAVQHPADDPRCAEDGLEGPYTADGLLQPYARLW